MENRKELSYNVKLTSYEVNMRKSGTIEIFKFVDNDKKAMITVKQPKTDDIDWGEFISEDIDKAETLTMHIGLKE